MTKAVAYAPMTDMQLRFVDLYCGLGGFHVALSSLGHKCVFASEIDSSLRRLYKTNFDIFPEGNIRDAWMSVPDHDVLCAGFPCQPFSKAGPQRGFECPESGDLFDYILNIIDDRHPSYLLFENVPNIIRHADGQTWRRIQDTLRSRGYAIDYRELSPHMFGIPQVRNRAIIVGSRNGLDHFRWPIAEDFKRLHISSVLSVDPSDAKPLPPSSLLYLDVWEDFLSRLPNGVKMPWFPIWAMEFGADYPLRPSTPSRLDVDVLAKHRGAFGEPLEGKTKGQQIAAIPPYARTDVDKFPSWKIRFIELNREFFCEHRDRLEDWLPRVRAFHSSFQKLEWNWQKGSLTVWDKIIQFRASGIRVKNPATAPSLVALTTSQVPVIAWERRYMTMRECARLQSLDSLTCLPSTQTHAFRALGNAVNADVIRLVASNLVRATEDGETVAIEPLQKSHDSLKAVAN